MLFGGKKLARLEDIQLETITDRVFRVDTGYTSVAKDLQKGGLSAEEEGLVGSMQRMSQAGARVIQKSDTHTHMYTSLPEELIASLSETQISRPTDERHSIR